MNELEPEYITPEPSQIVPPGRFRRLSGLTHALMHRKGWFGVWDALRSAVRGEPRYMLAKPVQFYIYVQSDVTECSVRVAGIQLELND